MFKLVLQQLSLSSSRQKLIDGLNLTLESGEVLGILGANGAGKSSLLAVMAGLAVPDTGQINLGAHALLTLPPLLRAQHIGLLPQRDEGGFLGTVFDFVALGRYPSGTFDDAEGDVMSHLMHWELATLARRGFATLSGGEQQRARLAQLSVQAPPHYLLDEPLTHLDPAHQARFLTWARAEADAGRSITFTLHDPNWAAWHCDRLLFLFGEGRWQIGSPETLLTPPSLEGLYGASTAALWHSPRSDAACGNPPLRQEADAQPV